MKLLKKGLLAGAIVSAGMSSAAVNAAAQDGLAPVAGVNEVILSSGNGYELKRVSYSKVSGGTHSADLFFIHSAQGAMEAAAKAGLPQAEASQIAQDFQMQAQAQAMPIDSLDPGEAFDSFDSYVIHKDISNLTTQAQADAYIQANGLQAIVNEEMLDGGGIGDPILMSRYEGELDLGYNPEIFGSGCNGWKHRTKKFAKNVAKNIDKKERVLGSSNAYVDIDANLSANANANLDVDYKYKRRFCIPYKLRVKTLKAKASYSVKGDFDVEGYAKGTINGKTWKITEPTLFSQWFMAGPVPVHVKGTLPIHIGTGNIEIKAEGNFGLNKPIDISGSYEYHCDKSACTKKSGSQSNLSSALSMDNIGYQALASVKLTPWVEVAFKAKVYYIIWAKVGVKPSLPIALTGYYGNMCGNGDGLGGNETVKGGLLDVDFAIDITADSNVFSERSWQVYRTDLYFRDLLNPSTVMSPIIRPAVSDMTVSLPVSVRDCAKTADKNYMDYTVYWGDGTSNSISNLSGTRTLSHAYATPGSYQVEVKHKNSASTKRTVTVTSSTTLPGAPTISYINAECIGDRNLIDFTYNSPGAHKYQVYFNNSKVYEGPNKSLAKIWFSTGRVDVKVRAGNDLGWGPYKTSTKYLSNCSGVILR